VTPLRASRWTPCSGAVGGGEPSVAGGSVRPMMGMGGAGGRDAERRRRLVAMIIVVAMILAAGATVLAIVLS
jgi:hypothetical protein